MVGDKIYVKTRSRSVSVPKIRSIRAPVAALNFFKVCHFPGWEAAARLTLGCVWRSPGPALD